MKPARTAIGERPELAWLPVQRCGVNPAYQRTIKSERSQAMIAKIAADFRWAAFQAVLAAPDPDRDGWFLVLDGQHRIEAARRVGIDRVPAVVVAAVSVAEQALAFVRANQDRVAVNPFALFHAKIVAGDPTAQAVAKLCDAAGLIIPRYPVQAAHAKPGETMALGTITTLRRGMGDQTTGIALKAVADAWARHPAAVRSAILKAAAGLIFKSTAAAPLVTRYLDQIGPERFSVAVATEKAKAPRMTEIAATEAVLRRGVEGLAVKQPSAKPVPTSKPVEKINTPPKPTRAEALSQVAAVAARPKEGPPLGKTDADRDREAVERHLATKGARKVEPPLDVDLVMNEVRRGGYEVVPIGDGFSSFRVEGKKLGRSELIERANRSRAARKLPAWAARDVTWKRPPPPETKPTNPNGRFFKRKQAVPV